MYKLVVPIRQILLTEVIRLPNFSTTFQNFIFSASFQANQQVMFYQSPQHVDFSQQCHIHQKQGQFNLIQHSSHQQPGCSHWPGNKNQQIYIPSDEFIFPDKSLYDSEQPNGGDF